MATKYYAVKVGRNPGIYTDVEEYRKQIDGYSGFQGRVFKDENLANEWLSGNVSEAVKKYYAVRVGRQPGVYTTVKDYRKQTDGFAGFEAKVFDNLEDAQAFVCARSKYYAVRNGRVPGIYTDFAEYSNQVNGFPCAEGKKFKSLCEAQSWLAKKKPVAETKTTNKTNTKNVEIQNIVPTAKDNEPIVIDTNGMIAYVDGSFNAETKRYAYGVVVLHNGKKQFFSGSDNNDAMVRMCNVAGEIAGAMRAMKYAADSGINEVTIVHDYNGIADLCTGVCNPLNDGTASYKAFYEQISALVNIKFQKVDSHTGNYYNDLADGLARKAAGIRVKKTVADLLATI